MPLPIELYVDPPLPPRHLAKRCTERFRLWRRKRRWMAEMADAAALGRLDDILNDIGMTHAELEELMAAPADSGRQFEIMAEMEGLDLDKLPSHVLREAMWQCTRCPFRAPCKRWLRTGEWRHQGDSRCPNAALLHPH